MMMMMMMMMMSWEMQPFCDMVLMSWEQPFCEDDDDDDDDDEDNDGVDDDGQEIIPSDSESSDVDYSDLILPGDIQRFIICGDSLVSLVLSKLMVSTPATAVQNFLRPIGEASSQTDVENYVESRLELVRLCSMTTVLDIVAHSRRLVDADIFEHLNERTGNMDPIGVCNTEYELFCEVGAIWLANQHRMRPFQPQPHMNRRQRRLFQQN